MSYTGPKARVMVTCAQGWTSRIIERFDGWSHYANVLWDGPVGGRPLADRVARAGAGPLPAAEHGWVLDARSDWVGRIPPGVEVRPRDYLVAVKKWVLLELPTRSEAQYLLWEQAGLSQLHKPYDKLGILNFITGQSSDRNWREQSAWFCDEIGVWMLEQSHHTPPLPTDLFKLTPGAALMLCVGLGALTIDSSDRFLGLVRPPRT